MDQSYIYAITALLPLSALMLLTQRNPYHALVIRGILGAVAALVYAMFGAADVALTEALVGTMLAITLYAVAVRSSLMMKLGVLPSSPQAEAVPSELTHRLRTLLHQQHMRLELVTYADPAALHQALLNKDVHAIWGPPGPEAAPAAVLDADLDADLAAARLTTRVRRLHELMQPHLPPQVNLTLISLAEGPTLPPPKAVQPFPTPPTEKP